MELLNKIESVYEADIYRPLITYLLARREGKTSPKYSPHLKPLSLSKLAKIAQIYLEGGLDEEAGRICALLDEAHRFPSIWCTEKEYNPEYFQKIYQKLSSVPRVSFSEKLDISFINNEKFEGILTRSGNGTSMGAIRSGDFEIRAFGPQSQAQVFGILGDGLNGWAQMKACKEIWVNLEHYLEKEILRLKFRFVGLKPGVPQCVAFYVKGKVAQVEGKKFFPKSLDRFKGQSKKILFEKNFSFNSPVPLNLELIPLAGEGCYWDSDFLILFELSPFLSSIALDLN